MAAVLRLIATCYLSQLQLCASARKGGYEIVIQFRFLEAKAERYLA